MTDPHTKSVFGGIDDSADSRVPGWFRANHDVRRGNSVEFDSFHSVVSELSDNYGAETTNVFYYDEERDEYLDIPTQRALVNPTWQGDGLDDAPQASAAWTTVSDGYSAIDAMDAYGPLVAAARSEDLPVAFGSVETYRNGGEVVAEVLFDDLRVTGPEGETEFVFGFETGYDHFRRSSVWASLLAYDTNTGAALRGLGPRETTAHRGDDPTADMGEWYLARIDEARKLGDTIHEVVAEARNYEVRVCDVPLSVAEWFEALGFPASYGRAAAERLGDHRTPTAFDLWLVMSDVVTTEFDGKKGGSAIRGHASRCNELLYSPSGAERQALESAHEAVEDTGQTTLDAAHETEAEAKRAAFEERIETLEEGVEVFENVRERVRAMLEDMDGDDEVAA